MLQVRSTMTNSFTYQNSFLQSLVYFPTMETMKKSSIEQAMASKVQQVDD